MILCGLAERLPEPPRKNMTDPVTQTRAESALAGVPIQIPPHEELYKVVDSLSEVIDNWNASMANTMSIYGELPRVVTSYTPVGFGQRDIRPWWKRLLNIGEPNYSERKVIKVPVRTVVGSFVICSPECAIPLMTKIKELRIQGHTFKGLMAIEQKEDYYLCTCDKFEEFIY